MKNKPCSNCPFRKDTSGFGLEPQRAENILNSIGEDSYFVCHKTRGENEALCIGSALFLEQTRPNGMLSNQSYRMAAILKIIPVPDELDRSVEVYQTKEEAMQGMTY